MDDLSIRRALWAIREGNPAARLMHTWSARAYSLATFAVTATVVLLALTHLTSYAYSTDTTQDLARAKPRTVRKLPSVTSKNGVGDVTVRPARDTLDFSFTLSYDVAEAFNWNVKQVYLSVVAVWEEDGAENAQTIWDRIVTRAGPRSHEGREQSAYPLSTYNEVGRIRSFGDVRFRVVVSIMPYAGLFKKREYELPGATVNVREYFEAQ